MSRRQEAGRQRDAEQFVAAVKTALGRRLEAVSLGMADVGLQRYRGGVITPGVEQFIMTVWAIRMATGEVKMATVKVGIELGHTSVDDVDPLAGEITASFVKAFYEDEGNKEVGNVPSPSLS